MPTSSGQVSFGRLTVGGPSLNAVTEDQLALLADHVLAAGLGIASETEAGWCAADHVFDEAFSPDKNLFGPAARLGLRLDTNKVPAEIKRAIRAQHQTALLTDNATGVMSRKDKVELRQLVDRALHDELATGKHRKSKLVPLIWDAPRHAVLCAASANTVTEALCAHWRATFGDGAALRPQSAGAIASEFLAAKGRLRELEDLRPSPFTPPPASADASTRTPTVPWAAASPEPLDYLGNEALIWLWWRCETGEGLFDATLDDGERASLAIALDRTLECACAWGVTGTMTLKGDDDGPAPIRLHEAADALATGKWPRRTGMLLSDGSRQWTLTLQADRWLVSGCTLPNPPDDTPLATERERLEWRIDQTLRLDALLVGLLHAFCDLRTSDAWPTTRDRIIDWIAARKPTRPKRRPAPAPSQPVAVAPVPAG